MCIMLTESVYYIGVHKRLVMAINMFQDANSKCFAHKKNENLDVCALSARPRLKLARRLTDAEIDIPSH
jgi:hypothetical protein